MVFCSTFCSLFYFFFRQKKQRFRCQLTSAALQLQYFFSGYLCIKNMQFHHIELKYQTVCDKHTNQSFITKHIITMSWLQKNDTQQYQIKLKTTMLNIYFVVYIFVRQFGLCPTIFLTHFESLKYRLRLTGRSNYILTHHLVQRALQ